MSEQTNSNFLYFLQRKWNQQLLFAHTLLAAAFAVLVSLIAGFLAPPCFVVMLMVFSISFFISLAVLGHRKIDEQDVISFLNQSYRGFEESAHLLSKPAVELNVLEKLQLAKIQHSAEQITTPATILTKIKTYAGLLFAVGIIACATSFLNIPNKLFKSSNAIQTSAVQSTKPEAKPPQVEDANIVIAPPFYMHKSVRQQANFSLTAEQKATITWTITTTSKAKEIHLLFSDKSVLLGKAVNKEQTLWRTAKQITTSGFYQVVVDGKSSSLYAIEMLTDAPPVINVTAPLPNKLIALGEEKKVTISVSLSDDYGLDSAYINATIASGSGEAVTFKQLILPFANFAAGRTNETVQNRLNLAALGMGDGDELYFSVAAVDNNRQTKHSDVYIIRLEDSVQLMSLQGTANALDIKPELFRSERQIIIETEQLLRDKDTLNVADFNERSNNLGTDQQLLRLRYGKYLGEETESEIAPSGDAKNDLSDFGNAAKVIDQYSDKHDAAEDANFFDAPTKKQLQLMLTEMWKASLQLKTYQPKAALPFAYNALRLLKDLQQKTRAYVAKTGVKTAPLQLEKRLSGELEKIVQPTEQQNVKTPDSTAVTMQKALGILEKIKSDEVLPKGDIKILEAAEIQLSRKAAAQPIVYLSGYQSLRKIIGNEYSNKDVTLAGRAFEKLLLPAVPHPQPSFATPDMNLSHRYFMNLTQRHD